MPHNEGSRRRQMRLGRQMTLYGDCEKILLLVLKFLHSSNRYPTLLIP